MDLIKPHFFSLITVTVPLKELLFLWMCFEELDDKGEVHSHVCTVNIKLLPVAS